MSQHRVGQIEINVTAKSFFPALFTSVLEADAAGWWRALLLLVSGNENDLFIEAIN